MVNMPNLEQLISRALFSEADSSVSFGEDGSLKGLKVGPIKPQVPAITPTAPTPGLQERPAVTPTLPFPEQVPTEGPLATPGTGLAGVLQNPIFQKALADVATALTARDPSSVGAQLGQVARTGAESQLFSSEVERLVSALGGGVGAGTGGTAPFL